MCRVHGFGTVMLTVLLHRRPCRSNMLVPRSDASRMSAAVACCCTKRSERRVLTAVLCTHPAFLFFLRLNLWSERTICDLDGICVGLQVLQQTEAFTCRGTKRKMGICIPCTHSTHVIQTGHILGFLGQQRFACHSGVCGCVVICFVVSVDPLLGSDLLVHPGCDVADNLARHEWWMMND